ncbi:hypothetical protein ACFV9C_28415 [Kribbella sp. NPDC059898]|uniref:hypothetical protein n=1 Tax=Kribbella sp. NPDC059898 TaxID=3346995 RepID=UPI00364BE91A
MTRAGRCYRGSGEIDDPGDVIVATSGTAGASPHMPVRADHSHIVEPAWIIDQYPIVYGKT